MFQDDMERFQSMEWFSPDYAAMWDLPLCHQAENESPGNLLEIGLFKEKPTFMLSHQCMTYEDSVTKPRAGGLLFRAFWKWKPGFVTGCKMPVVITRSSLEQAFLLGRGLSDMVDGNDIKQESVGLS